MPVWTNPKLLAGALNQALTRRIDIALIGDSRGTFQSMGWDHGIQQALISSGIKLYGTGLMSPGEHGTLGTNSVASGGGVGVGYRGVRTLADSGNMRLRTNDRVHSFALRNMEAADIANLTAGNLATWDTRTLANFAPNEPLWFDGIRNLGISSIVGGGVTVTVTTVGNHGLTGTPTLTIRGTPTGAYNSTFVCTVATVNTFTFANATVATHNTAGVTYGYAKLASGATFNGNDAVGINIERGSPLGNDAALRGHIWASRVGAGDIPWRWLANGTSVVNNNFAPTTSMTRMDADLTVASSVAGASSPGRTANTVGIEFRVPEAAITATGVFWPWIRVTRPDRTAGAALSTLYALGGQSSYDMALALTTMPLASLTDYFARLTELQTGQKIAVVWLSTGMNDAGEASKLPAAPGANGFDKSAVKYNLDLICTTLRSACNAAGVQLVVALIGDYPRGAATEAGEITAATYRDAMREIAASRPDFVCFGDMSQIVTFAEIVDVGTDVFRNVIYGVGATNGTSSAWARAHPYLAVGKTARFTGATTNGAGLLTATLAPSGTVSPTHIRIESGTNVTPGVYAVASGTGPWQLPADCDTGSGSAVTGTAIDCVHLEEDLSFQNLAMSLVSSGLSEAYGQAARQTPPRIRQD